MGKKEKLINLVYKIDSSAITTHLLTLGQVLAMVAFGLYSLKEVPFTLKPILFYIFIVLQLVVAFVLILRSGFASRYSTIKLLYNKVTGMLFDKEINVRNVSLRCETLQIILKGLSSEKETFGVGKNAGKSFYNCFEEHLQKTGKKNLSIREKIDKWGDYDSSAGIGKFEIGTFEQQPFRLVLTIANPFTGTCENGNICMFLKGYVVGFCERVFNQKYLTIECQWVADSAACKLTINESNKILSM